MRACFRVTRQIGAASVSMESWRLSVAANEGCFLYGLRLEKYSTSLFGDCFRVTIEEPIPGRGVTAHIGAERRPCFVSSKAPLRWQAMDRG